MAEAGVGFILAASVDTGEKAGEVAGDLDFPVAGGGDARAGAGARRMVGRPQEHHPAVRVRAGPGGKGGDLGPTAPDPSGAWMRRDVAKFVAFYERRRREAAKA